MQSWQARVLDVLQIASHPTLGPEYAVWARPWTTRFVVLLMVSYGGVVLLALWPLDFVTLGDEERAGFAQLRLANVALCALSVIGLRSAFVRAHVQLWAAASLLGITSVGAWFASALPHDPYYWPGLVTPLGGMMLLVPIGRRCVLTTLVGIVHNVAWYAHQPSAWDDPTTLPSLGLYAMAIVLGIGAGHMITYFTWQLFLGRRELSHYNERLEREVSARTADVRRLAERVRRIHEDEKRRLAAELHDELGQTLTALRLETAMLERGARPEDAAAALHEQLDELFESVRFIVGSLRPKALDVGLRPACEWLVERFRARTGIETRVSIDEVERPGDDESLTVFRVLQESLTNVARHAEASWVTVALGRDATSGEVVLRIEDDGVGFDPDARTEGHGVSAMRERALAIDAVLAIRPRAPGTSIELRIGARA